MAICPAWQGRVMTSTCSGPSGPRVSGSCYRDFIDAGKDDPHFNNYGGEDRFWLSPEGGRFVFRSRLGRSRRSTIGSRRRHSIGPFEVVPQGDAAQCRLTKRMKLKNAAATEFDLTVAQRHPPCEPG